MHSNSYYNHYTSSPFDFGSSAQFGFGGFDGHSGFGFYGPRARSGHHGGPQGFGFGGPQGFGFGGWWTTNPAQGAMRLGANAKISGSKRLYPPTVAANTMG